MQVTRVVLGLVALRRAFGLALLAISWCLGLERAAWASEKLGYVEMSERRGGHLRETLVLWHKLARGGLVMSVIAAVVLAVLLSTHHEWA